MTGQSGGDRRISISTDEDMTLGFMCADRYAPKTRDERAAAFAKLALVEWGYVVDPAKLAGGDEAKPYVLSEDEEMLFPAKPGDDIDSHWFIFTDLDEAMPEAAS